MSRVVIIQAQIKHYRVPFFQQLYEKLKDDGITLQVVYSAPNAIEALRKDTAELPSAYGRKVRARWIANRFLYQTAWKEIWRSDLIIVGNEHKYLINPVLLTLSRLKVKKVAFWGMGLRNSTAYGFSERLRRRLLRYVDWWFAYTSISADHLQQNGVKCGITTVQNAVDTAELMKELSSISEQELHSLKSSAKVGSGPVAVFCGNLSKVKQLPFLLASARLIRERIPGFELVIAGDGQERAIVEAADREHSWLHYVGPQFGPQKAAFLRMATLFLLPGAVGLGIVEAFAAGLPVVTTELLSHGPEISYLEPGVNGEITQHSVQSYAQTVIDVLVDQKRLRSLQKGAFNSSRKYTVEAMSENFRSGIRQCLKKKACAFPVAEPSA